MIGRILWIIVSIMLVVSMVYWEIRRKKTTQKEIYHEKSDHEKQIEQDIAIEKGKNHGPMGGNGGGF